VDTYWVVAFLPFHFLGKVVVVQTWFNLSNTNIGSGAKEFIKIKYTEANTQRNTLNNV